MNTFISRSIYLLIFAWSIVTVNSCSSNCSPTPLIVNDSPSSGAVCDECTGICVTGSYISDKLKSATFEVSYPDGHSSTLTLKIGESIAVNINEQRYKLLLNRIDDGGEYDNAYISIELVQ